MTLAASRRDFNRDVLASALAAFAVGATGAQASAQTPAIGADTGRRQVIKQLLPGAPERELILIEVKIPAGDGVAAALACERRDGLRGFRRDRVMRQRRA
jgi:hypothetical protein